MSMELLICDESAVAALGTLMEYPDQEFFERVERTIGALGENVPEAAEAMRLFRSEIAAMSIESMQEQYTRSFDLSPVCPPYLSVHLFGGESFKRAELMVGLADAYRRVGFERGTELPDHIAQAMQSLPLLESEERAELVAMVLLPATEKMLAALDKAGSPWRHLVRAARVVMTTGDGANGQ